MQQCINVQIPESMGGLEGQAVYIDTEGSFMSNRAVEIAQATVKLLAEKYPRNGLLSLSIKETKSSYNILIY